MHTTIPTDHPVIGISGGSSDSASVRAMVAQVQAMGGTPMVLSNHTARDAAKDIAKIDALIVMGNDADIDPSRYIDKYPEGDPRRAVHAKTDPESKTPQGKARADYEYALVQHAIAAKMPVLGVCAGMQRLNVIHGGTLHQDIVSFLGHNDHAQHESKIAPFVPVQVVHIDPATTLGGMASGDNAFYTPAHRGNGEIDVGENSMHHQAVEMVGKGLRASAFAEEYKRADGSTTRLIEAIEADPAGPYKDQFLVGVQWHPEFGASPLGPKIVGHLVGHGRAFAKQHQRVHTTEEVSSENILSSLPSVVAPAEPTAAPGGMTERIQQRRAAAAATSKSLAG